MEKNQVTGLILISLMLMVYLFWFGENPPPQTPDNTPGTTQVDNTQDNSETTNNQVEEIPANDSILYSKYGALGVAMTGESQEVSIENKDLKITFSSKGAQIENVLVKNYVDTDKEPLNLITPESSNISEMLPTNKGNIDLGKLFYTVKKENDLSVTFEARSEEQVYLKRTFTLAEEGYVVDYDVDLSGIKGEIDGRNLTFNWKNNMRLVEKDIQQSRTRSTINYYVDEQGYDYLSETSTEHEETSVEGDVKWVSMKQKYFNSSILTDAAFKNVLVATDVPEDERIVKSTEVDLQIPLNSIDADATNLRFYFGPNDYHVCENVAVDFEKNVYY